MNDFNRQTRLEQRRREDSLVRKDSKSSVLLRLLWVLLATVAIHGAIVVFVASIPEPEPEPDDETVQMAIVQTPPPEDKPAKPEEPPPPPPEPEPDKPPEPEPEPAEKPEPKPEHDEKPKPEPEEKPEPEPEPEEQPEPKQQPDESRREQAASEAESMDALEVQGMDMNSTVQGGDGPTMKVGKNLDRGRITDNYVDPDRMDDVETGEGDGAGKGASATPGSAEKPRNCPERQAKPTERHQVPRDQYPLAARRRGIQGTVVGLATVGPDGRVKSVKIIDGVGHGLDELAANAFRKWRFEPARANCQTTQSKVRVRHQFKLSR